jgi:cell division protein FtsB
MARQAYGAVSLSFPPPQQGLRRPGRALARPWLQAEERVESLTLARAIVIALMIVITALALLYLWQGWQLTSLQARLATRQAAVERIAATNEVLKLKAERSFSLERIDLFAKTVLGMVEPSLQYIHLPEEGR